VAAIDDYTKGQARDGALAHIPAVRAALADTLPGKAFDEALLRLAREADGPFQFQGHPVPNDLTPAKRAEMVFQPYADVAAAIRAHTPGAEAEASARRYLEQASKLSWDGRPPGTYFMAIGLRDKWAAAHPTVGKRSRWEAVQNEASQPEKPAAPAPEPSTLRRKDGGFTKASAATIADELRKAHGGDRTKAADALKGEIARAEANGETVPANVRDAVGALEPKAPAKAAPEKTTATTPKDPPGVVPGTARLVDEIDAILRSGEAIPDNRALTKLADAAFGGTRGQGKYTPKDAYDALEAGVNRWLERHLPGFLRAGPKVALRELRSLMKRLPTQTDRTTEQVELQQFSTPPTQGLVAATALQIREGEVLEEPSAGVGGLAVFARAMGADVHVNEIATRRVALLKMLGFEKVTSVDGELLNDMLPDDIKPTAILMNPPFSATGGRVKAHRTEYGAKHVEQALERLQPGGRLVAIVGGGMAFEGSTPRGTGRQATGAAFREWWTDILGKYNVRANLTIPGDEYAKYGTTFDNQILVIDKTGPTPGATFKDQLQNVRWGRSSTLEDALDTLRTLDRPAAGRPADAVPGRVPAPARDGARKPDVAVAPDRDGVLADDGAPSGGASGRRPVDGAGAERPLRAGGPTGGSGAGVRGADAASGTDGTTGGGPVRPGGGRGEDVGAKPEPVAPATPPSKPEAPATEKQTGPVKRDTETGGTFVRYAPAKIKSRVLQKHPAPVVEAASMAAVDPPDVTYESKIPVEVLKSGRLSDLQYETVLYAGQRHAQTLPGGERAGYFIGDGTGVGKGREIAGVILDNWMQGRKKVLWLSVSNDLAVAARGDLDDVAGKGKIPVVPISKYAATADIDAPNGVVFSTYASLVAKAKGQGGQTRQAQIEKWLGEDGVIVFDEAHMAKNAVAEGRGEASQRGEAVVNIQRNLPGARVLYVSATGATDVRNMAYMTRLGLWAPTAPTGGLGTMTAAQQADASKAAERASKYPFASINDFLSSIEGGGVGAKEMVSRDLKALGMYASRSISFEGVDYRERVHPLTPDQQRMYDDAAKAWQVVLQNIDKAIGITNGDARARSNAMKRFWGDHQRFFRQVTTAMKMPTAIKEVEEALAAGESAIVTLKGTGESKTAERVAKAAAEGNDLDDLDFTPRETLAQMVDAAFPTALYQDVTDPNTGKVTSQIVRDAEGNVVHSKAALALKQKVMDGISGLTLPDNPLDQFVNHFGGDRVAEMTGRKKRLMRNAKTGKTEYVKRAGDGVAADKVNLAEMEAFQSGKKRIAVISRAASTGISLHASNRAKNQQRRRQIAVELDWSADSEMQTFGRSHRSDQASPPTYVLVSTDVGGEKRFSSTIARRLASLGALTKGSRDATGGGSLASYNFETTEGGVALTRLYTDMLRKRGVPGVEDPLQALKDMGIWKESSSGSGGGIDPKDMRDVPRFLNRVLALDLGRQNAIFAAFADRFEGAVLQAKEEGAFDEGVADIKGDSIRVKGEPTVIHTDETTGAQTQHITLEVDRPTTPTTWKSAEALRKSDLSNGEVRTVTVMTGPENGYRNATVNAGYHRQARSGAVVYVAPGGSRTDAGGTVIQTLRVVRPNGRTETVKAADFAGKWEALDPDAAKPLWEEAVGKIPKAETVQEHVIAGSILPLWSKLQGSDKAKGMKVVRATADNGQRVVGLQVPREDVGRILRVLGVGRKLRTAYEVWGAVKDEGESVSLQHGMVLRTTRVHGEERIEITGVPSTRYDQLRALGLIEEKINWSNRFFVPTEEARGKAALGVVLRTFPPAGDDGPVTREHRRERPIGEPDDLGLFSQLERAVSDPKAPTAQSGSDWLRYLQDQKRGVKADELKWTGTDDFLRERGAQRVTRDELAAHVASGAVEVREVTKGRTRPLTKEEDNELGQLRRRELDGLTDEEGARLRDLQARYAAYRTSPTEGRTKFDGYVLPGGENYREVLLRLPDEQPRHYTPDEIGAMRRRRDELAGINRLLTTEEENEFNPLVRLVRSYDMGERPTLPRRSTAFRAHHFDEANILAHVRLNDRTDADGKRVLFVEEIQSDYGQAARHRGIKSAPRSAQAMSDADLRAAIEENDRGADTAGMGRADLMEMAQRAGIIEGGNVDGVPPAPFIDSTEKWLGLALRRVMRLAAEGGYDRVAWTTGEQQAARYDLSKQVDSVHYNPDTHRLVAKKDGAEVINERDVKPEKLPDYVGKDVADKIMQQEPNANGLRSLSGDGLKVGGDGMRGFYDQIVPAAVGKLAKKWGAKVGATKVSVPVNGEIHPDKKARGWTPPVYDVHSIDITPEMRRSVMEGQPRFRTREGEPTARPIKAGTRATVDGYTVENPDPATAAFTQRMADAARDILPALSDVVKGVARRVGLKGVTLRGLTLDPGLLANETDGAVRLNLIEFMDEAVDKTTARYGHLPADQQARYIGREFARSVVNNVLHELAHVAADRRAAKDPTFARDLDVRGHGKGFAETLAQMYRTLADYHGALRRDVEAALDAKGGKSRDSLQRLHRELAPKWGRDGRHEGVLSRNARRGSPETRDRRRAPEGRSGGGEGGGARPGGAVPDGGEPPAEGVGSGSGVRDGGSEVAGDPREGWISPGPPSLWDKVRVFIQDRFLRIKRTQEAVATKGGTVTEESDVYRQLEAYDAKVAHQIREAERTYRQPVEAALTRAGLTLSELDDYLLAKHAPDGNRVVAERGGAEDGGIGMTNAEAREILDRFDTDGKTERLEAAAERVRAALAEARRVMVESGLLSDEERQAWEARFGANYVPVRSFESDDLNNALVPYEDEEGRVTGRGRFDVAGPESRLRTGRRSKADSPTVFAMSQLYKTIARAEKNKIRQGLARLVRENPDDRFWKIDVEHRTVKGLDKDGQYKWGADSEANRQDLKYKEDGVEHRIWIADPLLQRALKDASAEEVGKFLRFAGGVTRWYTMAATGLNPEFLFTNLARDVQAALGATGVEQGADVAKDVLKTLKPAIAALVRDARGKAGTGEWDQHAKEFLADGGSIGFIPGNDPQALLKDMERSLHRAGPGAKNAVLRESKALLNAVQDVNKGMESASRLALYVALRKRGATRMAAAHAAKNVTVNFNRRGEAGVALNALYAFVNANIQGTASLLRVLASQRGAALTGALMTLGFLLDQMNRAMSKDADKDGRLDYDAIPAHVLDRNLIIGGATIPLPYGFNVIVNAGRLASAVADKAMTPAAAAGHLGASAWNAFNPLGGEGSLAQMISPTFADPIVQWNANENFAGQPIQPTRFPGDTRPESERYFKKTISPWAREMARLMNLGSGGDKVTPGYVSVSPELLEHVVDAALPGVGSFLSRSAGAAGRALEGEFSVRETPILRRFVHEPHPGDASTEFRRMSDELDTLKDRYDHYVKAGQDAEARRIPRPLLSAKRSVDRIESRIRALRKRHGTGADDQIARLQRQAISIVQAAKRAPGATS
jgi:hypothetical protein